MGLDSGGRRRARLWTRDRFVGTVEWFENGRVTKLRTLTRTRKTEKRASLQAIPVVVVKE